MRARTHIDVATYAAFVLLIMAAPVLLDEFWLNRIAKFLVFGILGVAISLSWGFAGILNLGQGLFFGLGAYMTAMSLKLAAPTSLRQGSRTPVPDFMLWNAEPGAPTELCCINHGSFLWVPFMHPWFGVAMSFALPALVAAGIGGVMFAKRISGVFVAIIMLALMLLVRLVLVDAQPLTNGFNGLTDLGDLTLLGIDFDPYSRATYYLVAGALALALLLTRLLLATRAGLILQATREEPARVRTLGFNVPAYQTFFFVVSALIAGLAGLLYVTVAQFASPTFMDLSFSITMVVWAAVGGRASLLGAAIGAILINVVEANVSEGLGLVQAWRAVIGLIFVLAVLYLPRGLAGLASDLADLWLARRKPARLPAAERRSA